MPTILDPNASGRAVYESEDLSYKYPSGLDLRPGSPLHAKLLTQIYSRAQESSNEISKRYASWKKVDETLTAYIYTSDAEKLVKEKDERKPVSIVVPYSYATLETILTYFVMAFLEDPIFRYSGAGPEDTIGAILLEKVVELQTNRYKAGLALHTMFRDSLSYGMGIVTPTWEQKWGWKSTVVADGFFSQLLNVFMPNGSGKKRDRVEAVLFEGNKLSNVDPYMYLPDPNVPIHDVQSGEFVGWIQASNYMKLLEVERNDKSFFNVQYLKGLTGASGQSVFNKMKTASGRSTRFGTSTSPGASTTSPIDVIWLYWTLIPKDQGLGSATYPEKWLFGLAADKIIICAKPLGLNHDMYPVAVCAPDFDGYSPTPVSRLELMYGMQEGLNWLFNSHMTNVRKAINDMLIVDPSLINMADLEDPGPGKLIRMRRAAWGRGVDKAVMQLPVQDITSRHIADASVIADFMQRTSAATDALSGMVRKSGERVTAAETQGTMKSALSRLTKAAKIASMQAMQDLAYMYASHTQQLMSKDVWVKSLGTWQEVLMQEFGAAKLVTPVDLIVDYDIIAKDGSVQGNEYNDAWVEVWRVLGTNPMLLNQIDGVKVFKHIARILGAKDINDFVIQKGPMPQVNSTVQGQGVIDQGVQTGDLMPLSQVG